MDCYAKSSPDILTIVEHTEDVVQASKVLYQSYGKHLTLLDEKDWKMLEIAAQYHDIGKYSMGFQNRITAAIHKKKEQYPNMKNYPHNYLSVMLMPFDDLYEQFSDDELDILTWAVGYHHERDEQPDKARMLAIYEQQLKPFLEEIEQRSGLMIAPKPDIVEIDMLVQRWNVQKSPNWLKYILIKGLLQRADHAASAKRARELVDDYVEQGVTLNVGDQTRAYLESNYGKLRPLQQWAFDNQAKNLVLVAQTGSGKTEASLLWIGERKGFLTLPLRVSLNAMYDRIIASNNIAFSSVGLLHSSALDYLMTRDADKKSYEQSMLQLDHTRRWANKLTLSTLDQLFKFPLLYRGFEVELSTLAYSKVVIDEIQAYDAHLVAILLTGLKMIQDLGGQWMIMTATLPAIFKDELKRLGLMGAQTLEKQMLLNDDRHENVEMPRRHRIQLMPSGIEECVSKIQEYGATKKVLVVVNTIKQALKLYDLLQDSSPNLLHSQFIMKHRQVKEKDVLEFAKLADEAPGIWITTQIVEASLDVDFDYLFTEAATPDALFQRLGRCNRAGKRFNGAVPNEPNVFICAAEESTGVGHTRFIYEQKIVENGLDALSKWDGELLDEQTKIAIVDDVFSKDRLQGTKYLQLFTSAMHELERMPAFEKKKDEAQGILRDIQTVSLVPGLDLYNEVVELIEQYHSIAKHEKAARKELYQTIQQHTVSVNKWALKNNKELTVGVFQQKGFEHLYFATDVKYNEMRGLELALDEDSLFSY